MRKGHEWKMKFRDLPAEEQKKRMEEHLEKAKNHSRINHPVRIL